MAGAAQHKVAATTARCGRVDRSFGCFIRRDMRACTTLASLVAAAHARRWRCGGGNGAGAEAKLLSGEVSFADAWKNGSFDTGSLVSLLEQGPISGLSNEGLRATAAQTLLDHAPEASSRLDFQGRWALADGYAATGDADAIGLYKALFAETADPYDRGLLASAPARLSIKRDRPEMAVEAYLSARPALVGRFPHFAAEVLVYAARLLQSLGRSDEAEALFVRFQTMATHG